MTEIIRFIKKLLGTYESGHEYWVYTDDIKVPLRYKRSKISSNNFIDGFSSVKIAHIKGIDKVPVHFVD